MKHAQPAGEVRLTVRAVAQCSRALGEYQDHLEEEENGMSGLTGNRVTKGKESVQPSGEGWGASA